MRENTDQENSEYGHFSRSLKVMFAKELKKTLLLLTFLLIRDVRWILEIKWSVTILPSLPVIVGTYSF